MSINFKCKKIDFKNIDLFLSMQEYEDKPSFDTISIDAEGDIYNYCIRQESNNKYYIVTD